MNNIYQEIRKQEALERIALKQGRSLLSEQLPVTPIPVPAKPIKARPQRFHEGHWKECEFCKEAYRVRPSHGRRRRACSKPECKAQARSARRRRKIDPKQCEYSGCNNTLNPRSKQKRFCSKRCAGLYKNELKKLVQYKTEIVCIIKQ